MVYLDKTDTVLTTSTTFQRQLWSAFKTAFRHYTSQNLLRFALLGGGKPDDTVLTFQADKMGSVKSWV
jgi:hypothetical protein